MSIRTRIVCFCLLAGLGVPLPIAYADGTPPSTPADWQAIASRDLDATYHAIVHVHPGAIDAQNPAFRDWMTDGYIAAKALLPRVYDYSSALLAVRYYVVGFEDGHLLLSDNTRPPEELLPFMGWAVEDRDGELYVRNVAAKWDAPLPPIGARVVSCDGRPAPRILKEDVAPFYDRRPLVDSRASGASMFGDPFASMGKRLRQCTFLDAGGRTTTLDVHYQDVDFIAWLTVLRGTRTQPRHDNEFTLRDGVLWIKAGNFQPNKDQYAALQAMLPKLQASRDVHAIVFDVRGNGGGNSGIGDAIFEAATGGLVYDQSKLQHVPVAYAQWRVSDAAIDALKKSVARAEKTYGPRDATTMDLRDRLHALEAAQRRGDAWAVQMTDQRLLTREQIAARGGHLKRFNGQIVIDGRPWPRARASIFVDGALARARLAPPGADHKRGLRLHRRRKRGAAERQPPRHAVQGLAQPHSRQQ